MAKERMTDAEQRIVKDIKDPEFKKELTDGFLSEKYMTADDFIRKMDMLKETLKKKKEEIDEMPRM